MFAYDSGCCFRGSSTPNHPKLLWEITTDCNLACDWCHVQENNWDLLLTTNEIIGGLRRFYQWGIRSVIFSGGEPLLRKDFFELVEEGVDLGLEVDVCTNGTLVNEEAAYRLKDLVSEISVSIDSAVPAIHNRLRGKPDAFVRTVQGIKHLVEAGLEVHAISLCCDDTAQGAEGVVGLLLGMGVHSVTFLGFIKVPGVESPVNFHPRSRALLENSIPKLRGKFPDITINTKRVVKVEDPDCCGAGETIFGVDASGNLLPCILLKGKIPSRPLSEFLAFEGLEEVRKQLFNFERLYWRRCGEEVK